MAYNRLRLDFSLNTTEERLDFVESYLPTLDFQLTEHETETLSDYILWGKNSEGQNVQQEGIIKLKEWAPQNVDSIEGLMDVPGFQEARLQPLHGTHYRAKRVVFNRKDALSKAPPYYQELLITLFNEIDRTELLINYYDLLHGKRKTPPRASLVSRFSEAELNELKDKAIHLNQKKYIQLKHYLVELRNEQYTYKDSFSSPITHHGESQQIQPDIEPPRFDADVLVFPFGLYNDSALAQKIFKFPPDPSLFND